MLVRCSGNDRFYPMLDGLFETQETWAVPGEDGKATFEHLPAGAYRVTVRKQTGPVHKKVTVEVPGPVVQEIREWMDRTAEESGLIYLLGPIPTALRPRLITPEQLDAIQVYSGNLWEDCKLLERLWREGSIQEILNDSRASKEVYRLQPWQGSPAQIASDGLFGFGAQP